MSAMRSGIEAAVGGLAAPLFKGKWTKRVRLGSGGREAPQGVFGLDAISQQMVGSEDIFMAKYEYRIRHPEGYVMEMPQSGERIRGRENMRSFQEAFPSNSAPPTIWIRRVLVRDGLWVVESVIDYGEGQVMHGVAILELRDGKVWRDPKGGSPSLEHLRAALLLRQVPNLR